MEKRKMLLRSFYIRTDQDQRMNDFKSQSSFSKGDVVRAAIDFFLRKEKEGKLVIQNGKIDFI